VALEMLNAALAKAMEKKEYVDMVAKERAKK
jgi:hypothetical protein